MSKYGKEVIDAMRTQKIGKSEGEIRWYFENVALPYRTFHHPKEVVKVSETDPLCVFRLLDEMFTGYGVQMPYSLTPDMVFTGTPGNDDKILLVNMPDPKVMGHAYAIIIFTDNEYDMPGYFMLIKGAKENLNLIAWDYKANVYNLGLIDDPEKATQIAYNLYINSRNS